MGFNFKKAAVDNTFADIPAGWYTVEMSTCAKTTSQAGKPMLKIQYTILDASFKNRKIFHNIVLNSPKVESILGNLLKSINSPLVEEENATEAQVISEFNKKKKLSIHINCVEGLNGKMNNNVLGFKTITNNTPTPISNNTPETNEDWADTDDSDLLS